VGFGYAFEVAHQEIVQTLVAAAFVHREPLNGRCRCTRRFGIGGSYFGLYNVFH
jgi:hypothetical protein